MNPRYLAYCRAHGRTTDDMLTHDTEAWPGGKMCGFMLWMSEQWQTFMKRCPHRPGSVDWDIFKGHAAETGGLFDQWQTQEIL